MHTTSPPGRVAKSQPRKAPNYLDIALAMATPKQRLPHIRRMRPHPSKHTLLRACDQLRKNGLEAEANELRRYCEKAFPARHFVKTKISVDETRIYYLQENDSGQFVRVPSELFRLKKRAPIEVTFHLDEHGRLYFIGRAAPSAQDQHDGD